MLPRVQVQHECDKREDQPGAVAGEQREASARELGATGEVQQPQALAQLPVRLRREAQLQRRSPGAQHAVSAGVAVGHVVQCGIGDLEQDSREGVVQLAQLLVELLDRLAQRLQLAQSLGGRSAALLLTPDFGGGRVALGLELLDAPQQVQAPRIEPLRLIHQLEDRRVTASREDGAGRLGRFTKPLDVDHVLRTRESPRPVRESRSSGPPTPGA